MFIRDNDISLQIVRHASQARGYAKTISKPYFISTYNIDDNGSKHEIHDIIEQLLEGARFIYKVNHCPCINILLLRAYIFMDRILYRKQAYFVPLFYKLLSIRYGSRIKRMRALYTLNFRRMTHFPWLPWLLF